MVWRTCSSNNSSKRERRQMDSKEVVEANSPHRLSRSSIPAQGSPAGGRTPPKVEPSLLQAKHPW